MQAWLAALNEETDNKEESKEFQDNAELADETKVPMEAFFTRCDAIAMIADETKKATAAMEAESIKNTIEDTIADVMHVGYTSSKERINAPIFHLVEKALINVPEQGCLETLLVCRVDKLAESDSFMDALIQGMVRSHALIKPVAQSVKHHMEKINGECRLERMLKRQVKNE